MLIWPPFEQGTIRAAQRSKMRWLQSLLRIWFMRVLLRCCGRLRASMEYNLDGLSGCQAMALSTRSGRLNRSLFAVRGGALSGCQSARLAVAAFCSSSLWSRLSVFTYMLCVAFAALIF